MVSVHVPLSPVLGRSKPRVLTTRSLEDDTYTITEVRTDNGYTLLKDDIAVVISQTEATEYCDIYASDVLGLLQLLRWWSRCRRAWLRRCHPRWRKRSVDAMDYDSLLNLEGNGVMGYVEIPAIDVLLPIYHGVDGDSLERGAGHMPSKRQFGKASQPEFDPPHR